MAESKLVLASSKFDPEGGLKEKLNPVILLHALLCSKEVWVDIPQRVANATGRRVYTYDARNHGDSPATEKSNFSFNVVDLFTFMDRITAEMDHSPEKFIVVGHDMGGMTAISAALHEDEKKRDKFEMVIVVEMYVKNIPSFLIERAQIITEKWADCVRRVPVHTPMENVARVSVDNLYEDLDKSMQEENEKESFKKVNFSFKRTGDRYGVKYHTENINCALEELKKHEGYTDDTEPYDGPACFIYSLKSNYKVKEERASIRKLFRHCNFVEFDKGSHFFVADVPDQLAEELIECITADD